MRIISGNSRINVLSQSQNNSDFIVLAEIIDSSVGYEKPILIKNSRDLLIWFGNEFKEYNYFKELLDRDKVCLYLYRGIETENSEKTVIDKYYYIPDVSPNTEETLAALEDSTCFWIEGAENNINLLPEIGEEGNLYKVIRSDGINYDSEYNIRYSYYQYIDNTKSYILYDSLDETLKIKSLQNRDRLSVGYYQYETNNLITYSYYHPGMDYISEKENNIGTIEIEDFDKFQKRVLSGHLTRHLIADSSKLTIDSLKKDPHVPIINVTSNNDLIYTLPTNPNKNNFRFTYFYQTFDLYMCLLTEEDYNRNPFQTVRISLAHENFLNSYLDLSIIKRGTFWMGGGKGITYSSLINNPQTRYDIHSGELPGMFLEYKEFYNMPEGFEIKSDFLLNQKDIYDYYVDGNEIYRFESKTIGKGSEDIKVEIRKIETYDERDNYSITISRYDYQEFFEGPLEDEFGFERLDYKISKNSKLVRFKIIPTSKPELGWPEGEWELKGAYVENNCNSDYSFNTMCKSLEDFPPDFILVPDKQKATSESRILDWTKVLNCQALITNNKDDVESNLESNEDPENRLIHFYNQIRYSGEYRPGYYIFLKGLLNGDNYLPSIIRVVYHFPEDELDSTDKDYEKNVRDFYEKLEKYRSNSLNLNNYYYYYDYYLPGENYTTTPLVRFVISKITRELEKNKWKIIGEKASKISEDILYPILRAIQNQFSIIRSIEINRFIVDGISRTVEASITTRLSDIISSDVSFDIILNYSKLNN